MHVERSGGHHGDGPRGTAIRAPATCALQESADRRRWIKVIEFTRQKRGRQRVYPGGTDSLGPAVHPVTAAGRERESFAKVADHGPTDPVRRDGTVCGQHGDAHRGQRQSTPPVIRPIHRVDDEAIQRRPVTKSDLAGFLGPQNPAATLSSSTRRMTASARTSKGCWRSPLAFHRIGRCAGTVPS